MPPGRPANIGVAEEYVKIGDEFAEQERWDKALEMYNAAIKRYPELANAYYRRGLAHKALEKYYEARCDFDKAQHLGLEHADLYFHCGFTFYRYLRVFPTFAIDNYNMAIELDPNHVEAYYWRGRLWYEAEHNQRAVEDFTKVIQLDPDNDAAYSQRGSAYYEMFQCEKAIADFTHVIERNRYEKMHFVYFNRAIAYRLDNQYDLAIQDHTEAIRIKPDFRAALSALSELQKEIKRLHAVIEGISDLIALAPDEISNYLERARAYEKIGEYKKAVDDFTEAIHQSSNSLDVHFNRAEVYQKMGLYDQAIADYDHVINHASFEPSKQTARNRKAIAIRLRDSLD